MRIGRDHAGTFGRATASITAPMRSHSSARLGRRGRLRDTDTQRQVFGLHAVASSSAWYIVSTRKGARGWVILAQLGHSIEAQQHHDPATESPRCSWRRGISERGRTGGQRYRVLGHAHLGIEPRDLLAGIGRGFWWIKHRALRRYQWTVINGSTPDPFQDQSWVRCRCRRSRSSRGKRRGRARPAAASVTSARLNGR